MTQTTPRRSPRAGSACSATVKPSLGPVVHRLPVELLSTSHERLRPGKVVSDEIDGLADLPLRVAVGRDGTYEVLDGFKRLERWRLAGITDVPVVVESCEAVEQKRLLLLANGGRRTVTPMDEALVVQSLMDDDGFTPKAVSKLLGRRLAWVMRRRNLAKGLSRQAAERVATNRLGVSLAETLTGVAADEQDQVLDAVDQHGLRVREAVLLVETYCGATPSERRALLQDPLPSVRPPEESWFSPRAVAIEDQLTAVIRTLEDLQSFEMPADLAPAEERRLTALYRSVLQTLEQTVRKVGLHDHEEDDHEPDEDETPLEQRDAVPTDCLADGPEETRGAGRIGYRPRSAESPERERQNRTVHPSQPRPPPAGSEGYVEIVRGPRRGGRALDSPPGYPG